MSSVRAKGSEAAKAIGRKSAATKLAKRILIKCAACGMEWREKPSHAWRKYCSLKCAGNSIKRPRSGNCVICGNPFKITWKNAKNKTCSADCAHRLHSQSMRNMGHNPRKFRDADKWLASIRTPESRRKVSEAHKGKVRVGPRSKRLSAQHARAVEFFVRDPAGAIHHVANITKFVTENPHLFLPEDVIWKPHPRYPSSIKCNASHGLSTVYRGRRMTWKGWTLVSNREGRERFDHLRRIPTP